MRPVLKEVFRRIKIIPISSILLHEGVVEEWAERLSTTIDHDGIVKNPIIVTRAPAPDDAASALSAQPSAGSPSAPGAADGAGESPYIALDGMHRIAALKALGCRDILVYEVDYFDPAIALHGWDALILDREPVGAVLEECARREERPLRRHTRYEEAVGNVCSHRSCLGLLNRAGEVVEVLQPEEPPDLERLIRLLQSFEQELDRRRIRVIYVADEQSLRTFEEHRSAGFLLKRPYFTKEEVIRRSVEGKVLPRKSTRHLFPMRPLRVDIDFILLKEEIDLRIKNRLLQARLNWLLEHNMVRYYPESVLVLSD